MTGYVFPRLSYLAAGVAPSLRNLFLELEYAELEDEAIEALATIFEARAQCPACRGLELLKCDGRVAGNSRLMRALLPSVVELELSFLDGDMDDLYQNNFASNGAPQLQKLKIVFLDEEGENIIPLWRCWNLCPPWRAWLLIRAIEVRTRLRSSSHSSWRVAFQRLQHLCLSCYCLGDIEWDRVLRAIACVAQLSSLKLSETNISPANMSTLSTLFGQNNFPTLQSLRVSYNYLIGDQGVELLVEGLLAPACRTRLTALDLHSVKMGDKGVAALVSAVREGRSERLEALDLGGNSEVTSRGVCALARAVRASGGQKSSSLLRILVDCHNLAIKETAVVELASVLMNNCPRLKKMGGFSCSYSRKALHEKLLEIVHAAGYQHRLKLQYCLWDNFDN